MDWDDAAQCLPGERFKCHATVSAAAPDRYPMGGRVFLKLDPGPRLR
jgi:hypothetical protein